MRKVLVTLCFALIAVLSGCGGGSGSEPGPVPAPPAVTSPVIEFLLEARSAGSYQVNLEARPADYEGSCMVRLGQQCVAPKSVEFTFATSADLAFKYTTGPANNPTVRYNVFADRLPAGEQLLKVVVKATASDGTERQREGYLRFDPSTRVVKENPGVINNIVFAQAGFLGAQTTDLLTTLSSINTQYPREPIAVTLNTVGLSDGMQSSFQFLEKPMGSTATLSYSPLGRTATFIPDVAGEYVVVGTPVFSNGKIAWSAYASVFAPLNPYVVGVSMDISPTASEIRDDPLQPPNTTRIYVSGGTSNEYAPIVNVQALLDGKSLGILAAPNVKHYVFYQGYGYRPSSFFSFDMPNSDLGAAQHSLSIRLTNTRGDTYVSVLPFTGGNTASKSETFTVNW